MLDLPDNENIRGYLKHYTSVAHLAGTESDKSQAEWTRDKFIEFGIANTTIKTYYPLLNYPVKHRLAIVSGPEELRYEAELREDVVDEDETSKDPDNVPTFHGNVQEKRLLLQAHEKPVWAQFDIYGITRLFQKWHCHRSCRLCKLRTR